MKDHDKHHGDITLHDIVDHILGVQKSMRDMDMRLSGAIKENAIAIHSLEENMNRRFDAVDQRFSSVDEDLVAIAFDVVAVKQYVGMPVASDG